MGNNPRSQVKSIRLSDAEIQQLQDAAQKRGQTLSDFIRATALRTAKRIKRCLYR